MSNKTLIEEMQEVRAAFQEIGAILVQDAKADLEKVYMAILRVLYWIASRLWLTR